MKGDDDTLQSSLDKYEALANTMKTKVIEQLVLWSNVPAQLFTVTPVHCAPEYYEGQPRYDGANPHIMVRVNDKNADPTHLERANDACNRFSKKLTQALKRPAANVFELAEAINTFLSKSLGKIEIPEIDGYRKEKGGIA